MGRRNIAQVADQALSTNLNRNRVAYGGHILFKPPGDIFVLTPRCDIQRDFILYVLPYRCAGGPKVRFG